MNQPLKVFDGFDFYRACFLTLFISVIAIIAVGTATNHQALAAPAVCGNGVATGYEACDGTDFAGGKNKCSDWGYAGNNSLVACNADCTVNTDSCLATDAGTDIGDDAGTDVGTDVGSTDIGTDIGVDGNVGDPANCRAEIPAIDTVFESGSLIIPMDVCGQGDILKALGLVFFLSKYGIRIAWALNTNKTSMTAPDFSIDGGDNLPVNRYERHPTDYTKFNSTGIAELPCISGNTISYSGNPLIIPAADVEAALELIYQGTLPEDPTVKFGYANDPTNRFANVTIHKAMVPFTAPIEKITSIAPKRWAIVSDDADFNSWIQSYLASVGLDFPGAGSYDSADINKATLASPSHTNFVPGLIYDYVTMSDVANGYLESQSYHLLWMASYSYTDGSDTDQRGFKTITNFVEDGRALLAMDKSIASLEQLYKTIGPSEIDDPYFDTCPEDSNCTTSTRFMTQWGIVEGNAGGGFTTQYPNPASPMLQVGSLDFQGLGGTIKTWKPENGHAYKYCVQALASTGTGIDLALFLNEEGKGPVIYMGGHQWSGQASQKTAARKFVTSMWFKFSYLTPTTPPQMIIPVPGTTIPEGNRTFFWSNNGTSVEAYWLYVGSSYASGNLYNSGSLNNSTLSKTVMGLPADGRTLFVRLWYKESGTWKFRDYTYTAAGTQPTPSITSPTIGTILSGSSVTFSWTSNDATACNWWLYAGSIQGFKNYHDSGSLPSVTTSYLVGGLPLNGAPVWIRLWYGCSGVWKYIDAQYTASIPSMMSPTSGSTLSGSSETFTWQDNGWGSEMWWLYVGSTQGANNYHDSGWIKNAATVSRTVNGLPTNGSTIWVRLWFKKLSTGWQFRDVQYTASN